ncbi:MAG: hypothetical protein AB7N76_24240 [Planctomycetota bacterium]
MTAATTAKTAIVVLSDPNGSEEALGRVFNALAAAYELVTTGGEVSLLFLGAGTRWPERLIQPDHPAHGLFQQVKDRVAGASCGCAEVFGAVEGLERACVPLLKQLDLPGTSGVASLDALVRSGATVLTF